MGTSQITDAMTLNQAVERLSPRNRPHRRDLSSEIDKAQPSWDLNAGFGEACRLAREGWQQKAAELWRNVQALALETEYGIRAAYDVSGDSVDIGRFLEGEPECMLSHEATTRNTVQVLVNISARCNAPAELLFNRGIAIAAVIHALQGAGRNVSLMVTDTVMPSNDPWSNDLHETIVEVGTAGEYLNPARIAFWLAHPAALRRCMFRFNEQQDSDVREKFGFFHGSGYGRPTDNVQAHTAEDVVYIPFPETSTLYSYTDAKSALGRVIERFKEKGIPISVRGSSS